MKLQAPCLSNLVLRLAPIKVVTCKKRALVMSSAISLVVSSSYAADNHIGDLSIYEPPKDGGNIMMMVDVSGSMGVILRTTTDGSKTRWVESDSFPKNDNYSCVTPPGSEQVGIKTFKNIKIDDPNPDRKYLKNTWITNNGYRQASDRHEGFKRSVMIDGVKQEYYLSGCVAGGWDGGQWSTSLPENNPNYHQLRWDKISELKDALIQALGQNADGSYRIASKNLVGLGRFPSFKAGQSNNKEGGQILVPARALDSVYLYTPATNSYELLSESDNLPQLSFLRGQELRTQRERLIEEIKSLTLVGNTPSANAYAEAGAYMLGNTTYSETSPDTRRVSGVRKSAPDASSGDYYIAPAARKNNQCYGKGIYFLTDGKPNRAYRNGVEVGGDNEENRWSFTPWIMDLSLGKTPAPIKNDDCPTNDLNITTNQSGWNCIGEYAKELRNYQDITQDIRTATVGFGLAFSSLKSVATKNILTKTGDTETIIDCRLAPDNKRDAKNLCLWGMMEDYTGAVNGEPTESNKLFGGGGFTVASNATDIQESLEKFINSFSANIDTLPSGTIAIPDDPYQSGSTMPFAYLPMLKPSVVGNDQVWAGNLKRYRTSNGTLFGKNDNKLFLSSNGKLNPATADLWHSATIPDTGNNKIHSGGFFAQLTAPHPGAVASTRNVFVENYNGTGGAKFASGLVKIGVGSNGHPDGSFPKLQDKAIENNPNHPRQDYGHLKLRRMLLNFLGYDIDVEETARTSKEDLEIGVVRLDMNNFLPPEPIRVLGGIIHSKPALVSYSAQVDENGVIQTTDRDDYLLFGSMDGALHLANAETGQEVWAIVFQEMLRNQAKALVKGSKGALEFGVDAPWLVDAKYNYNVTTSGSGDSETQDRKVSLFKPTASTDSALINTSNYVAMAAYGGFRMGGDGLYALDLTDKAQPKVLFRITPYLDTKSASDSTIVTKPVALQTNRSGTLTTSNDDYSNVGQIWNKVTMGRITGATSAIADDTTVPKARDVIIFGGGYDMAYEDPTFVPRLAAAKGSSIYIADAKTGEQIWKWDNPNLHSIVAGVTALDRDDDGLFDHLYFADLGGNLFRADFINKKNQPLTEIRVTRIFAASAGLPITKKELAYRFYNRPVVSFYEDASSNIFALVNIASGDRSSPLSELRENNAYANRVYGIIDSDITRNDGFVPPTAPALAIQYPKPNLEELTEDDLVKLNGAEVAKTALSNEEVNIAKYCEADNEGNYSALCRKKVALMSDMLTGKKHGWYYPLTRFDGFENVKYLKAMGDYEVISKFLYVSVYDPNLAYETQNSCAAKTLGASEQQLYCLPYGICMDDSSLTGSGGFSRLGKGIQELSFGALDQDSANIKVLIGTSPISNTSLGVTDGRSEDSNRVKFGDDPNKKANPGDVINKDKYAGVSKVYGDGSMAELVFNERFILKPTQWYEAK